MDSHDDSVLVRPVKGSKVDTVLPAHQLGERVVRILDQFGVTPHLEVSAGAAGSRMKQVTAGSARKFFTFCRAALSEILIVSPSAKNHTALSWGRPSAPTGASMAVLELRRS